ncbi:MAG TPA: DUF1801 domain-containing protein [Terriglobia bacterium]|nr:DUF1801 domain-containing protein [Terriglobia bacterium]
MKKLKTRKGARAAKAKGSPKSIDEYLARVPEPARTTLQKVRVMVRSVAPPESTETISYGMPAVKYNKVLVWFAAFSKHCSVFPTSSVIEALKNELKGFHTSKGTIHFPTDKPLPAALIKRIVKLRVQQIQGKKPR